MQSILRHSSRRAHLARGSVSFKCQFGELERQRSALVMRLSALGSKAQKHPSHKHTLILINETFRKSSVAQRRAVLDAADWLIGLLEQLTAVLPASEMAACKIRRTLDPATKCANRLPPAQFNRRPRPH